MREWFERWREKRRLFREFLHSELIFTRHYTEERNKVYLGGDAPKEIGPGRIEVLYFPDGK
jgi:hypothetical protein